MRLEMLDIVSELLPFHFYLVFCLILLLFVLGAFSGKMQYPFNFSPLETIGPLLDHPLVVGSHPSEMVLMATHKNI